MTARKKVGRFWPQIFAVCFVLFVLEVTVRLFGVAPELKMQQASLDPYLPFKPVPLSQYVGETSEFRYVHRHNSSGFRDVEHSVEKPEGVYRILGLGDSFTYGVGVPFEKTYLSRLEEELNARTARNPEVEIIKAGIYRFFPEVERLLLQHYGLKFSPDLVLVAFSPNDVADTFLGLDAVTVDASGYLKTREAKQLGRLGTLSYIHCHACRIVLQGYVAARLRWFHHFRWEDAFVEGGAHEKVWQKIEMEYESMLKLARGVGAEFVIVYIPQKGLWTEESVYPTKRLARWSRQKGAHFVDALPAMRAESLKRDLYWKEDGHCNVAGHEVIANEILKAIRRAHLIPIPEGHVG